MSAWPLATLFDAVYASTVTYHFGVAMDEDVFHPDGPTKAAHADDKCRRDQADADKETSVFFLELLLVRLRYRTFVVP